MAISWIFFFLFFVDGASLLGGLSFYTSFCHVDPVAHDIAPLPQIGTHPFFQPISLANPLFHLLLHLPNAAFFVLPFRVLGKQHNPLDPPLPQKEKRFRHALNPGIPVDAHHHGMEHGVMHPQSLTLIAYSLILIAVGCFGYHKTGSLPSLYASLGFGILLLGTSGLIPLKPKLGMRIATILLIALLFVFVYRFICTGKGTPLSMGILTLMTAFLVHYKNILRTRI